MTEPQTKTVSAVALANSGRQAQLTLRTMLLKDVATLWPSLDAKRLDQTFPGWLRAMLLLVRNYHSQSSVASGAAYRLLREHATESPAPQSLIKLAPTPSEEWLTRAFGFSGPGMLSKNTAKPGTALSTTLGTSSRIVFDGSRTTTIDTTLQDPVAVGWYRITDGDPCAFCALLASRGAVYKEDTADFQAHNDCGCMAVPLFSRGQELPALNRTADRIYTEATKGVPSGGQLAAFRKAWSEHQAS